jgi:hypothetical protein
VTVAVFAPGGYRFIPSVFQYSAGVAAEPGYAIERVAFRRPLPLAEGFARVAEVLGARGRPLSAFCACELRSPAPVSDAGFRSFNEAYVGTLAEWGIYEEKSRRNPVARSNVCPETDKPDAPVLYAFSFTVASALEMATFVVAGSGEAREGEGTYRERTVRYGESGSDALRDKALFVMAQMERRLQLLGCRWGDTSATQVYTVHDLYPLLAEVIDRRGAAHRGLTWHLARPPVMGLEFEMDCRGVAVEHWEP